MSESENKTSIELETKKDESTKEEPKKEEEKKEESVKISEPAKQERPVKQERPKKKKKEETFDGDDFGELNLEDQRLEGIVFFIALFVIQLAIILIYAFTQDYANDLNVERALGTGTTNQPNEVPIYGYFRDVNIMIFFGFGFLMTFLKRYAYSALGYVLLISALVAQLSPLVRSMWFTVYGILEAPEEAYGISMFELVDGLFCAGAVMISFGGFIGKATPLQLLVMAVIEPFWFFAEVGFVNMPIHIDGVEYTYAHDIGGGMTIHLFGAYFGLAVTWWFTNKDTQDHPDNTTRYTSDIFSFTGTFFLWIMWPSFNAAITATPEDANRALVNTFLSICSSVLASFAVSRILSHWKFEPVHIQNSTLAGGVAMGVVADWNIHPAWAMFGGVIAGTISVLGYKFGSNILNRFFKCQDVCGIHNLHGMPGLISSYYGVIAAAVLANGRDIDPGRQAAALHVCLGMGLVGGFITGGIMRFVGFIRTVDKVNYFNDRSFWFLPNDYEVATTMKKQAHYTMRTARKKQV